ncbi:MAG: 5-(carboxyamino)imidazole ribonucleotide mutase [Planctomycetaceae bacterium]|nr:5-(carboxyamino)imidazole ribonucleotide mutase [Planctomycetaceae bacterium]
MSNEVIRVGVVMGSRSDWPTMAAAAEILEQFCIRYEARVVSAHRTPQWMAEYAESAQRRGLHLIIAGAGGAAHLPGMIASQTILPVLGVPIQSKALNGMDSLLSIVQMPGGIPVGTMAIGTAGAKNAGLLAVRILSLHDERIRQQLLSFQEQQTASVMDDSVLSLDDLKS